MLVAILPCNLLFVLTHPIFNLYSHQSVLTLANISGMRLAEQEMRVLIIKLLQRYRLEWPADMQPMGQKYVMLHRPDCEPKIAFIPRG